MADVVIKFRVRVEIQPVESSERYTRSSANVFGGWNVDFYESFEGQPESGFIRYTIEDFSKIQGLIDDFVALRKSMIQTACDLLSSNIGGSTCLDA